VESPPRLDSVVPTVNGRLCPAVFEAAAFPYWCDFGGVIEASFDSSDRGSHKVELTVTEMTADETHCLNRWNCTVAPPTDLLIAQIRAFPFAASFGVHDPAQLELSVRINDTTLARRTLAVVHTGTLY
jgi:hypothetical protein